MKTKFYLLFATIAMLNFASCKKCTTCEVLDSSGNVVSPATETCGNKDQVSDAKEVAKVNSILIGGTYSCTDK